MNLEWVRGHDGNEGNVHKLANEGVEKPERPLDMQWASKRRRLMSV